MEMDGHQEPVVLNIYDMWNRNLVFFDNLDKNSSSSSSFGHENPSAAPAIMSKTSLKPSESKREVETVKQKLLSDDDELTDEDLPWRVNNDTLAGSYNNNRSLAPARYLLRMLTSIGLSFAVLFIVFDSFKILIAAVIYDSALSIAMMVISVVYRDQCPLQKNISPALFAYAFTNLLKNIICIWNNRASMKKSEPQPQRSQSLFGRRLESILFNSLQLLCLGFFVYACIIVFPLFWTMDALHYAPEDLHSTRNCNKLLYYYSFSFLALKLLYGVIFLAWIPCVICLLKE